MTLSERSALPGWPYLIAGIFAYAAFHQSQYLPDIQNDNDEFVHELQRKRSNKDKGTLFVERWMQRPGGKNRKGSQEEGEEYRGLLDGNSDEEDSDEEEDANYYLSEIEESASELEDSGGKDGGGGEDFADFVNKQ